MKLVNRICLGIVTGIVIFALWRCGIWCDSLVTMRTPLWYEVNHWSSIILSVFFGIYVAVTFEP